MLENKVKKFNNLEVHLSYNVLAGKPPDEIIKFSDESDIDLIVMASSRISSLTLTLVFYSLYSTPNICKYSYGSNNTVI